MKVGQLIELWLRVRGIPVRDFAKEIGVSPSTVSRITSLDSIDKETMLKLINWLFQAPKGPK